MRLSILLAAALALQTVSVQLNWHAPAKSSEAVVGYNVYRANAGSSAWVKINKKPVPTPAYKDESVQRGHSYSYSIRSVDAKWHESEASTPWSVTIPKNPKQKVVDADQSKQ